MGMTTPPNAGRAVMYSYIGLAIGDIASGWLSQIIGSRKRVVLLFIVLTTVCVGIYFSGAVRTPVMFYVLCVVMGFSIGYWAVFVTIGAEQFGTNIRATVTTTVPNFVRGAVVLLTSAFTALKGPVGILGSAGIIGAFSLLIAFLALTRLDETYGKELNYVEEDHTAVS